MEACCDDDAHPDDVHLFIWGRHNPTGQVQEASASSEWVGLLQPGSRGENNRSGRQSSKKKKIIKYTLSSSLGSYWITLDTAPESLLWTQAAIVVRLTGTMWANIVIQWVCQYSFINLHQLWWLFHSQSRHSHSQTRARAYHFTCFSRVTRELRLHRYQHASSYWMYA